MDEQGKARWQYEYDVSLRYLIPLLGEWGIPVAGSSVIDVSCGYGGRVCSLHDAGGHCVGYDIGRDRIEVAKMLKGDRAVSFSPGSLNDDPWPYAGMTFDLVVLHDSVEHFEQKRQLLERLAMYAGRNGRLLVTFPPYYSAYGAHQQILHSQVARIPFFHLFPFSLSHILPRLRGEDPHCVSEVQKLGTSRMGIGKFETLVRNVGLSVLGRHAYIISPNHIRFGLTPISAGAVATIPGLREVLCTGVAYLLSRT